MSCYLDYVKKDMVTFDLRLYDAKGRLVGTGGVIRLRAEQGLYWTASEKFSLSEPGHYTVEIIPD